MGKPRDNFRLGLAVLVMFVLFFACLLFVGGKGLFNAPTREFRVLFSAGPAMPEIVAGSRVVCFGQPVGEVIATRYVNAPANESPEVGADASSAPATGTDEGAQRTQLLEVLATANVNLDLRSDCVVIATGPPLGGKGTLEIANRGVAETKLSTDKPVHGSVAGFQAAVAQLSQELDPRNAAGLLAMVKTQLDAGDDASLMAKIHNSLGDVNRMTAALARELDRSHEDRLLARVHTALERINVGLAELVDTVQSNRPHIDNTLAAVEHATGSIDRDIVGPLAQELDAQREGALLAEVHRAFERLNRSLEDLNVITGETEELVLLNSGRVDELVQNATEASILLRNGIKDVVLHPWKLFVKPTSAEKRELHILNVAREFAEASAHLDDATSRLTALLESRSGALQANDVDLEAIRAELAQSVEKFFEAEESLWQEMQKK